MVSHSKEEIVSELLRRTAAALPPPGLIEQASLRIQDAAEEGRKTEERLEGPRRRCEGRQSQESGCQVGQEGDARRAEEQGENQIMYS